LRLLVGCWLKVQIGTFFFFSLESDFFPIASQQTAKLEDNDEYKILLEDAQSRIEQLGKDFEHAKAQLVQARQAFALLQSQLQDAIAQKTQTEQDLQVLAKDRERIFTFLEEYKQSTGEKIGTLAVSKINLFIERVSCRGLAGESRQGRV